MSSPPSDPALAAALQRLADEMAALHRTFAAVTEENRDLRARLATSENARADLLAQSEHVLAKLAESRREIEWLRAQRGSTGTV